MTRERKEAIRQWQTAKRWIEENPKLVLLFKPNVPYAWAHSCWFCQYVRDRSIDYADNYSYQGCTNCPLNKWTLAKGVIKSRYDFGCTDYAETPYAIVRNAKSTQEEKLEACDLIIRALKGEHIWED